METLELKRSSLRRIRFLSKVAEASDGETWNHTLRINLFTGLLSSKLGIKGRHARAIGLMAQMHDVGKLRIRREILAKPGALSHEEFEIVKKHPELGAQMLGTEDDLDMAREIAMCHHERYDGTGYPRGLRGTQIPIAGRIVAIADVYDALRSRRPYKPKLSHEQAIRIITEGTERTRPEHFDPLILGVFVENQDEMDAVYLAHCDRRSTPRAQAA